MGKIGKKFLAIAILGLSLATLISGTAFAATKKKKRKILKNIPLLYTNMIP